jgi:hypothetical protein
MALGDPRPRFCPDCGQETHVRAPTLMEFMQQFGGAYFATEGALWRTLKLLLVRPGGLTREYLAGRRKHYVLPLRLYLSVSLPVLLALRLLAGTDMALVQVNADVPPARPANMHIDLGAGRTGLLDGTFYCTGLPDWLCRRVQRRIDLEPAAFQREAAGVGERLAANLGAGMFVLLPAFALWLKLAYAGRGLRFTEHLVVALHVHSFWFLMLGLTLLGQDWLTLAALLAVPVYTWLAMRQVYGGRWWTTLLRAGLASALYGITLLATLLVLALWAMLA